MIESKIQKIKCLRWSGNHHQDRAFFDLCHEFILDTSNSADDRIEALKAIDNGMGIEVENVTVQDLETYMAEQ